MTSSFTPTHGQGSPVGKIRGIAGEYYIDIANQSVYFYTGPHAGTINWLEVRGPKEEPTFIITEKSKKSIVELLLEAISITEKRPN